MKRTATPKQNKVSLFLDSGAYSAWSQGSAIDIDEYIKFIKKNKKSIDIYANLDSINNPEETYTNQKYMEEQGLTPVPVYHYGEDIKWLQKYLEKGYDYIALGGMVPISTVQLIKWLDKIYGEYLTDSDGMPVCKVHGFGLTSLRLMQRYPWYSVDSTSWVLTGRMGSVFVPKQDHKGGWDYSKDPYKVSVSARSPDVKNAGQHITNFSKLEQKAIGAYLEAKGYPVGSSTFKMIPAEHELASNERWVGKAPKDKKGKREIEIYNQEGLCNKYQLRDELNIIYFLDLEKELPKWPWAFKILGQKSFF
jgi:hypothetical protein